LLLALALGGLVGCGAILGFEPLTFDGETEAGDAAGTRGDAAESADGASPGDGGTGDGTLGDGDGALPEGATLDAGFCTSSILPDVNMVCDDFDEDRLLYNHLNYVPTSPFGTIEIEAGAAVSPPNSLLLDVFGTSDAGVSLGFFGNLPLVGSINTITCQLAWRVDNQPSVGTADPIDLFRVTLNNTVGPPYPTFRLIQWPDRTVGYQLGDFSAPGPPQSTGMFAKAGAFSIASVRINFATQALQMTINGDGSFPEQPLTITQPTNELVLSVGSIDVRSKPWKVRLDNFLCQ
jgi:hypothetical protein